MTWIGFVEGESSKESKVTEEQDLVNQYPNHQVDLRKEIPNQLEQPKDTRRQFNGIFFTCNQHGHVKK